MWVVLQHGRRHALQGEHVRDLGFSSYADGIHTIQARENVRRAVETRNPVERQTWLVESLWCVNHVVDLAALYSMMRRLFMKGARNLEFDKLREICGDYQQLSYAKGNLSRICYDSVRSP